MFFATKSLLMQIPIIYILIGIEFSILYLLESFDFVLPMTSTQNIKTIGDFSYFKDQCIGRGSYSNVYRGLCSKTGSTVAVKVMSKDLSRKTLTEALVTAQVRCLKSLKDQQNILKIMSFVSTANNYYLMTEFCPEGSLAERLEREIKFSQEKATVFIQQIINGYRGIVNRKIIHRDLKPTNMLLKDNCIKIGDFGFAINALNCTQKCSVNVGSPLYMPLQAIVESRYSYKSDIWAIGVIFFEMLTGKAPWKSTKQIQLRKELATYNITDVIPSDISAKQKQFLFRTLERDVQKRMSLQELLQFSFVQNKEENMPVANFSFSEGNIAVIFTEERNNAVQESNVSEEVVLKQISEPELPKIKKTLQRMNTNSSSYQEEECATRQGSLQVGQIQLMKKTLPLQFVYQNSKTALKIKKASSLSDNLSSFNSEPCLPYQSQKILTIPDPRTPRRIQQHEIIEEAEQRQDFPFEKNNAFETLIFAQLQAQVYYVKFLSKMFKRFNETIKTADQRLISIKNNLLYLICTKIEELRQLRYIRVSKRQKQDFMLSKTYEHFVDILNSVIAKYKRQKSKDQCEPSFQSEKAFLNTLSHAMKLFYQKISIVDIKGDQISSNKTLISIFDGIMDLSELFLLERSQNWQNFKNKSNIQQILAKEKPEADLKQYWHQVKDRFFDVRTI